MEDLEELLRDLGRPQSTAVPQKKSRGSSRVDLDGLDELMSSFTQPTPSPAPTPTPAQAPASATYPAATRVNGSRLGPRASTSSDSEDLDALMASLSPSRDSIKVAPTRASVAAPSPAAAPAPRPAPAPSRASQTMDDLDQLLSNLEPSRASTRPVSLAKPAAKPTNTFVNEPRASNGGAQPKRSAPLAGEDLDNMLVHLSNNIDVDTKAPVASGTCAQCRKPILGEVIQAMGKAYHPEHFGCGNCGNPLGTNNFYEQDGVPHCEKCYQELFCSRCAHCDEPILDRCVTALGKKWHLHHFICTQCLSPFEGGSFFERDSRPFCEKCFYTAFVPRCGGCNQPIRGEAINALGTQWHPEHFVCQYCQKNFAGGSFYEFGGKPYCEVHYHQQTGSLCAGCGKAVTGRCVNALDKKWHPEHFVCAFCMNPLAGGNFTENNGKAYCRECHGKLFG